jgi:hypothetical protein
MAFVCGGIQNFDDFGRLEKFNVIHRNLGFNIRAGEKNTAFSAVIFSPAVGVWGQSAPNLQAKARGGQTCPTPAPHWGAAPESEPP